MKRRMIIITADSNYESRDPQISDAGDILVEPELKGIDLLSRCV